MSGRVERVATRNGKAKASVIAVYTVNCPDCNRTGRIAIQGEPPMDLNQLYCPDCEPGTPPMEVLYKGKVL